MIVMKFGGTSVESAEAIQRVAGIVKSRLDRNGGSIGRLSSPEAEAKHEAGQELTEIRITWQHVCTNLGGLDLIAFNSNRQRSLNEFD